MSTAADFAALHRGSMFMMPNAWDSGSALLIQHLGFKCLGTSSAGVAYAHGYRDSSPRQTTDDKLQALERMIASVQIPVSADLENGLGASASQVQATFQRVANMGCAGASVEDIADYADPDRPRFFELNEACDRLEAAMSGARAVNGDFVVTGRTDYLLGPEYSLDEVIRRLQAFEKLGATCLFAPGIKTLEDVRLVASQLKAPINVLPSPQMNAQALSDIGIKRISLGSSLFRRAYASLWQSLEGLSATDGFAYIGDAVPMKRMDALMEATATARPATTR